LGDWGIGGLGDWGIGEMLNGDGNGEESLDVLAISFREGSAITFQVHFAITFQVRFAIAFHNS
jgi:hypothetical protein